MPQNRKAVIIGLASCFLCVWAEGSEDSRSAIDAEFKERLTSLASKCDELGLKRQGEITRAWFIDRDRQREYVFGVDRRDEPPQGSSELAQKWLAKFLEHRRAQAGKLFELSRQMAASGKAAAAYQLLFEVLREDPAHAESRRILGMSGDEELRPRSRSARLAHPKFGWPRGRWWQIDSPHFQIVTNHNAQAGLELAHRLEEFHAAWRQLFFDYWSTPEWLNEKFAGSSVRIPVRAKHQIVLFRNREEYLERLVQTEPQIALTLGYYLKGNRTSYFYAGEASLSTWYHEAAHQLFQETGNPIRDVGEKWNFWAVEGIAVYMESLTDCGTYYTTGGFDADRLQFARTRGLAGEPQMPLDELVRLGREGLQQHPDIRRLYTQAAGLAHFLMDYDGGKYRQPFIQYLTSVYLGRDTPQSLFLIEGLSPQGFQKDWRTFLTVRDADLRYLGPPSQRRNLSLLGGDISDEALQRLANCDQLEWLDLSFTRITAEGIRALESLNRLKRLDLVGVTFGDEAAPALASLDRLEELDVSGTAITDKSLAELARLNNLKVLRVRQTAVTDAGIPALASLKRLEELDVENTVVTDEALTRLKQQLPKLK